jgi:hypothetical protein
MACGEIAALPAAGFGTAFGQRIRISAMIGGIGSGLHLSSRRPARALRFAAVLLGAGLLLGTGPLHAQDEDSDEHKTFEEKLMDNLMSGLGGKKLEDGSIDYRERSPLVVPSRSICLRRNPANRNMRRTGRRIRTSPSVRLRASAPSRSARRPKKNACR